MNTIGKKKTDERTWKGIEGHRNKQKMDRHARREIIFFALFIFCLCCIVFFCICYIFSELNGWVTLITCLKGQQYFICQFAKCTMTDSVTDITVMYSKNYCQGLKYLISFMKSSALAFWVGKRLCVWMGNLTKMYLMTNALLLLI